MVKILYTRLRILSNNIGNELPQLLTHSYPPWRQKTTCALSIDTPSNWHDVESNWSTNCQYFHRLDFLNIIYIFIHGLIHVCRWDICTCLKWLVGTIPIQIQLYSILARAIDFNVLKYVQITSNKYTTGNCNTKKGKSTQYILNSLHFTFYNLVWRSRSSWRQAGVW